MLLLYYLNYMLTILGIILVAGYYFNVRPILSVCTRLDSATFNSQSRIVIFVLEAIFLGIFLSEQRTYARADTRLYGGGDKMQVEKSHTAEHQVQRQKAMESELDMVLAFMCSIQLIYVVTAFCVIRRLLKTETRFIAMEKQAKSATAAFLSRMNDEPSAGITSLKTSIKEATKEVKKKGLSGVGDKDLSGDEDEDESPASRKAKKPSSSSEQAEVIAMQAQSKNMAAEYDRLLTENQRLKSQLEDYDFVMGDAKKKKI